MISVLPSRTVDRGFIGGVMISVLPSRTVDRGFEPKIMKSLFVVSPVSTQHYVERAKTGSLGIRITCPSGATCLSTDC